MKRSSRFRVLFCLIICSFGSLLYSLDPRLLFDTYNSIVQNRSHLSPIHGAILSETGVLKNYYDCGMRGDPQIRLVRDIFVEALGNFVISRVESKIGAHLSPNLIGKIFGAIEAEMTGEANFERLKNSIKELIMQDEFFQESTRKTKKKFNKVLKELKAAKAQLKQEEKNILVKFLEQYKGYSLKKGLGFAKNKIRNNLTRKNINSDIKQALQNQLVLIENLEKQYTEAIKKNIEEIEKRKSDLNFRVERVDEFVLTMVGCFNGNDNYSPNFGFTVLQAFLYEKSESKQDLWEYFQGVQSQMSDEVLNAEKESFIESKYEKNSEEIIRENMELYEDLGNIETNFEEIAIVKILHDYYSGKLPAIVENKNVGFHGIGFSDCMETALRNLVQIILFSNGEFIARDGMNEAFEIFFRKMKSTNISDIKFHQKWSDLIENKEYLVYYRIKRKNKNDRTFSDSSSRIEGTEGFIFIADLDRDYLIRQNMINADRVSTYIGSKRYRFETFNIGTRKYVLVNPNKFSLFEVMPSVRNTITLLCDVFNINIVEVAGVGGETSFIAEFVKNKFNSLYFPKICKILGLKIESTEKSIFDSEDVDVSIYLKKGSGRFELNIYPKKHSEIYAHSKIENWGLPQNIFEIRREMKADVFWSLLCLSRLMEEKYQTFFIDENHIDQRYFFLLNIKGVRSKFKIIKKYFNPKNVFYNQIHEEIIDNLINSLPLVYEVMKSFLKLIKKYGYDNNSLCEKLIPFAKRGMFSFDASIIIKSLEIFELLVIRGKGFDQAIKAAGYAVVSKDIHVNALGFKLFNELVKKDQGFDQAIKAIMRVSDSDDYPIKTTSLEIFGALIEKNYGLDKAVEKMLEWIFDENPFFRDEVSDLLVQLFKRGVGFEQVIGAAGETLNSEDINIIDVGLKLFNLLKYQRGQMSQEGLENFKSLASKFDQTLQSSSISHSESSSQSYSYEDSKSERTSDEELESYQYSELSPDEWEKTYSSPSFSESYSD